MPNLLQTDVTYTDSLTIDFGRTDEFSLIYLILILLSSVLFLVILFLWIHYQKDSAKSAQISTPNKTMLQVPIYNELYHIIEENKGKRLNESLISETKWLEIFQALNDIHHDFTIRIMHDYDNLKKEDLHFCCLLKMGFKYSDIAVLSGRSLNMMYKRRESICKRLELDESQTLESFIRDY